MNDLDAIDTLSKDLGLQIRQSVRPDFFALLRHAVSTLDLAGFD